VAASATTELTPAGLLKALSPVTSATGLSFILSVFFCLNMYLGLWGKLENVEEGRLGPKKYVVTCFHHLPHRGRQNHEIKTQWGASCTLG